MALWTPPISDPSKLQLVHTLVGWHSLAYPFGQKLEPVIDRFLKDPLNGVPCNRLGEPAIVREQETPLTLLLDRLTINQPVPLHDFQAAAEDAYLTARRHGRDRGLIVIPTGGGKTTTFTHIVGQIFLEQQQLQNEWRAASQTRLFGASTAAFLGKWQAPAKTLVVVHTEEILEQNYADLVQVLGSEERVGKVQTRRLQQWDRPVVVVSIQTLIAMDPQERQEWLQQFGQVVLDEAHHYVFGNDWFVPLIEMGFFDSEGNITWNWPKGLLGVTATTDRYSGLPLRTTFGPDGIVYSIGMVPLIEKRVLVEPYGIEVRVKTSKTDDPIRALKELSPQEKADLVLAIFKNRLHLPAEGRYLKTRVFVDNMDDLAVIVSCLNAAGIKAVGITGAQVYGSPIMGTPMDRKSAIEAYGNGQFDALVTIKVGIEGHNDPGPEAGILVLSSDARGGVIQRIGRLLRQDPLYPERIVSLQPSHYAFLQTGDLSAFYGRYTRHMFYDDLLRAGAGDDSVARESGNLLVCGALKEKLGWTEAYQQTLPPAVGRTLDRYFDIVCDKYRGVAPSDAVDIPRGSALAKLIDSRQWPQFRGTNARNASENFQASLRRFFLDNGVPEAEADRLIEDAATD